MLVLAGRAAASPSLTHDGKHEPAFSHATGLDNTALRAGTGPLGVFPRLGLLLSCAGKDMGCQPEEREDPNGRSNPGAWMVLSAGPLVLLEAGRQGEGAWGNGLTIETASWAGWALGC